MRQAATVERSPNGQLHIHWRPDLIPSPVSIYWSHHPDRFNPDQGPLAVVESGHSVVLADPDPGRRSYFALVPEAGSQANPGAAGTYIVADRQLPLEGAVNFRDLGGYQTRDGRSVKWGRLYRSGELSGLTDADLTLLESLRLKSVYDLREEYEVEQLPDRPVPGTKRVLLPIQGGEMPMPALYQAVRGGDLSQLDMNFLINGNRLFVRDFTPTYAVMVKQIAAEPSRPAVFHCTAGKDRAGLGAAILLWILDVPMETVIEDYLLTNAYRAQRTQQTLDRAQQAISAAKGIPTEAIDLSPLEALLTARRVYLQAAIDTIHERYNTIEDYIYTGLGMSPVQRAKFQAKLLD